MTQRYLKPVSPTRDYRIERAKAIRSRYLAGQPISLWDRLQAQIAERIKSRAEFGDSQISKQGALLDRKSFNREGPTREDYGIQS